MNATVFFGLFACVAAQWESLPWLSWQSDRIHDHKFEYHPTHDILLVLTSGSCWIVDVDASIKEKLEHHDSKIEIEDELYAQIKSHNGEVKSDSSELRKYHDILAVVECMRHNIFHLKYQSIKNTTAIPE